MHAHFAGFDPISVNTWLPHNSAEPSHLFLRARERQMPRSILIVDDSEPVRDVLHALIETKTGFAISEAASGEEAIGKAAVLKPDLIVLDLALSDDGISGVETASILKHLVPHTRIVVFTMYGEMLGQSLTETIGIDAVVSKSDGLGKVIECVQKLLPPETPTASQTASNCADNPKPNAA
jgi:DNA-binding NarL/FixJ family response regulator